MGKTESHLKTSIFLTKPQAKIKHNGEPPGPVLLFCAYNCQGPISPLSKEFVLVGGISGQGEQIFQSPLNIRHVPNEKVTHLNLDFKMRYQSSSFSGCLFRRTAGLGEREGDTRAFLEHTWDQEAPSRPTHPNSTRPQTRGNCDLVSLSFLGTRPQ